MKRFVNGSNFCITCGAVRPGNTSGRVGQCFDCRYPTIPRGDLALWVPTTAEPGSAEKVFVLAERVRLGLPLFNPLDRRKDVS